MDSQSEWILLRRAYAFLKSRKLTAAAYALEQEAGLKFDIRHVHGLFESGRWRRADEYVSAFMRGREGTPHASGTLFPIRIQRLARALKRGDRAWADRYRDRRVLPLLPGHPQRLAADAELRKVLRYADRGQLSQHYLDDDEYRRRWFVHFLRCVDENKYLNRCSGDPVDLNLKFINRTASLGPRRYAPRRRPSRRATPSAATSSS